jgi:hypothetical protein
MPQIKDKQTWIIQMLEHRRTLFERVVASFPDAKKNAILVWRAKLRSVDPLHGL